MSSDPQPSDNTLVTLLAAGDIAALDMLYTRYVRPVYSLALRILGEPADAEEVTQDVFERVWRHAASFDPARGKFITWLLGMTHHVSIDHVRRRQRQPAATGGESIQYVAEMVPDNVDVSSVVVQQAEAEQVRRALRSLTPVQQHVIELAYFKGLSHLEIAALLNEPLGTIKSRIRRGMERLGSALDGFGIQPDTNDHADY